MGSNLYLVINTIKDECDPYVTVINICTNIDAAYYLRDSYINNYLEEGRDKEEAERIFIVREINTEGEVIFDCYNHKYKL